MNDDDDELEGEETDEDAAAQRRETTRTTRGSALGGPSGLPATPPANEASSRTTNGTSRSRRSTTTGAVGMGNAPQTATSAAPAAPAPPPNAKDAPWTDQDAEAMLAEMLGNEHPRCLQKLGKSAYDVICDVVPEGNPAMGSSPLETIDCSSIVGDGNQTCGQALRERVTALHFAVSKGGPGSFELRFRWRQGGQLYGRGKMRLASPAEIVAARNAQQPRAGTGQSPYGAPPPQYIPNPQPPPPVGYGAPSVQQPPQYPPPPPQYPYTRQAEQQPSQPSHDPEVSQLRTDVAGLAGAVRELMHWAREGGRAPAPQSPQPPQAAPGMGAQPGQGAWPRPQYGQPRSEVEELREEMEDMRDELNAYRRSQQFAGGGRPPGFGGAAPVATPSPAPHPVAPPPPPPAPRGPNGEIWVESARAWCMPVGMQPAAAHVPAPQPVPAPAPAPAAATQPVGVGATPFNAAAEQMQAMVMELQSGILKRVVKVAGDQIQAAFSGAQATGLGGAEEEDPEPPPAAPEASLPFEVVPVPDTSLFGHPVKYTPNKESGKLDFEGFVMSNPGVLEEGAKLAGVVVDAIGNFAKKAASATVGTHAAQAAQQLPAGVGHAQVVDSVPEGAQDATGNGSSFPRV